MCYTRKRLIRCSQKHEPISLSPNSLCFPLPSVFISTETNRMKEAISFNKYENSNFEMHMESLALCQLAGGG